MGRDGRQLEADCVLRAQPELHKDDRSIYRSHRTHATAHTSIQHTSRHITFTRTIAASAARAVDLGAARLSEAAEVLLDRRRLMHQRNEVGAREGEQFTRVGGASHRRTHDARQESHLAKAATLLRRHRPPCSTTMKNRSPRGPTAPRPDFIAIVSRSASEAHRRPRLKRSCRLAIFERAERGRWRCEERRRGRTRQSSRLAEGHPATTTPGGSQDTEEGSPSPCGTPPLARIELDRA